MGFRPVEKLGKTEQDIIRELQLDGRQSYADLARRVGVSNVTTRKKVSQLLESGVISIGAQANPYDLGYNAPCFIGMDVDRDAIEEVALGLAKLPEVEMVAVCNTFDILIKVTTRSTDDLYHFIMHGLKKFPAIRDTQTFLVFKFFKHETCRTLPEEDA